ncbi:hypothetical protein GCM10023258_39950 [Terrabacter aeriphilus]|uniref:TrwC relaxase domain-containing protein n=1 Tax=Terrabacter aeriphilus TaxID=515662 RepID=A0ABP9JNS9_9MICO
MGATSVATGSGVSYYQSHALEGIEAAKSRGYYSKAVAAGEPPAEVLGLGLEALGLSVDAELDDETAKAVWEELRHPTTGEALGQRLANYAGPAERLGRAAARAGVVLPDSVRVAMERGKATPETVLAELQQVVTPEELKAIQTSADRQRRESVTFYDTLYTQDKTVSIAHAVADASGDGRAGEVFEDALRKASEAIVGFADKTLYVRAGDHGKSVEGRSSGRYIRTAGVAAASYRHHTSRDGDMHDHAHVLILNRSQSAEDTKFRALDGTMLYNSMSATTALASRASEIHISSQLGWRWTKKADGSRYLAAVDEALVKKFSKRATAIEERLDEWADHFERANGRVPTPKERDRQHANIQKRTRASKPDVMASRVETVERWDDETGKAFSDTYEALQADARAWAKERQAPGYDGDFIDHDAVVTEALDKLTATRTKFTRWHLLGEIDRAMPANLPEHMTYEAYQELAMNLVDEGVRRLGVERLTPIGVLDRNVPAELLRDDGRSVFSPPDDDVYASVETLANEAYLLGRTERVDAPAIAPGDAAERAAAAGLSGDQAEAMASVLSSGRSIEVLVGPAGTGKSYTLAATAEAWQAEHRGAVIGLAKSNAAASVLRNEGLSAAWNCDRWLAAQERIAVGRGRGQDAAMALEPGSLVIVDEASMAETETLVRVAKVAERYGAKVVLTGDHRQLTSVGAGGFFELAANDQALRDAGVVSELGDVRRFANDWEGAASLRLREGDTSVLVDYDRNGRIVEEASGEALERACDLWVTDHLEGRDALIVVATSEEASAASMKIRRELVEVGEVKGGASVTLANGGLASVGDVIQARANNYRLTDIMGAAVSNRDRLKVVEVQPTGGLLTRRVDNGRLVRLNPDYVGEYVELAYAVTAHGAQGRTVDRSYAVVTPATDAAALYVGMTRGRQTNVAIVDVSPEEAHGTAPMEPKDAEAVLAEVMAHDSSMRSATAEKRAQLDASQSLARLGAAWSASVARQVEHDERQAIAEALGPELMARIDADSAAPAFWGQIAATKRQGIDPIDALRSTIAGREVMTARDPAALLAWRLSGGHSMAWEPRRRDSATATPETALEPAQSYLERSPVPESLGRETLQTHTLDAYARQLAVAMDARVEELGRRTATEAPEWATRHLGRVPAKGTSAREEWESKAAKVAAYREQYVTTTHVNVDDPVGPRPSALRSPERFVDWQMANRALGLEVDVRDVSKWRDRELERAVERWTEAAAKAPAYVRHELADARREAQALRSKLARLEAVSAGGPKRSLERLEQHRAKTEEAERYVETLAEMHRARLDWYQDTSVVRTTAREAAAELERRNPDGKKSPAQEPEEFSPAQLRSYEDKQRRVSVEQPMIERGLGISL